MAITPFTSTDQFTMAGFNGMIDEANNDIGQVTPIIRTNDPTTSTVGVVGQFCLNTNIVGLHQCVEVNGNNYIWNEVSVRKAKGSYIGTELSGESNPNRLNFPFRPSCLIVLCTQPRTSMSTGFGSIFISGQSYSNGIGSGIQTGSGLNLSVSWLGGTILWYDSRANASMAQLNNQGYFYMYYAFS